VLGADSDLSVMFGGLNFPALVFALVDNIINMGVIFVLIPIFYLKFNTQGIMIQKLAANSFHMYIVHAPILVAVSLVFVPIPLFPIIKLAIVFPLAVFLCYLASEYGLRKIL
ncbi:MAG: hypothetical protein ACW99R_17160, partial [Candidatus Hodarchaeales archaeon]